MAIIAVFALIAASTLGDWIWGLWHGPVQLSCAGQYALSYQGNSRSDARTLYVEIDLSKAIVLVESFTPNFKIELTGQQVVHFIVDDPSNHYSGNGYINRDTGWITVSSFLGGGGSTFEGLCHKAERLF